MLDDRFPRGSRYDLSALSVLVVEDNANMQRLLGAMLRALGVSNIRQAGSGEEALEILSACDTDIVITDWEMQPMNGLELTRRLRLGKDSPNPYVPIVMVTGKTEKEHVIAARDAGINHLLTKPVSVKGLSDRLVALIDRPVPFVRTKRYFGPDRRHHSKDLPEGFADRRSRTPDSEESEDVSSAPSKVRSS